ncbi:MAG: glycosyltransferase family 2 protein [Candidatus Sulfotelmatobacter sp.]
MRLVFWAAAALIGYTYLGYAACLWVRSRWRPRPIRSGPYLPPISIVLVVRNEAACLEGKLKNLTRLNYPPDRVEIVVVSDGSTDGTNRILAAFASSPHISVIFSREPRGKATGLNDAMKTATGEIIVFTDARQKIATDGVRWLLENFADPEVGCASGELILGDPKSGEVTRGMGLYWKIEKMIREMESASGSVVGSTGALYAVRRSLLVPLPPETILDDVFLPMRVLREGFRVVFDPRAQVWDQPDLGAKKEFARKVRTLSGNYQLLQLEPWLLTRANPIRFEFVSHKLLRLVVPFALCAALATSCLLRAPIYRIALAGQLGFYGLSAWALVRLKHDPLARFADAAFTFVLLNTAAVVAFANFIIGRKAAWGR